MVMYELSFLKKESRFFPSRHLILFRATFSPFERIGFVNLQIVMIPI